MHRQIVNIELPGRIDPKTLTLLEGSLDPVMISVPPSWCYQISRQPPPGGWSRALRAELSPSLFPEALSDLYWDEMIDEKGTWIIWALPRKHLEDGLGPVSASVLRADRRVRVYPVGDHQIESLKAFPNLAPPEHRPRRVPWKSLRRVGVAAGLVLVVLLGSGLGLYRARRKWTSLKAGLSLRQSQVKQLESELEKERRILSVFQQLRDSQSTPKWVQDLDALTRILPEDTRLVNLRWQPDECTVDLLTPNPEQIREILEAAPEFRQVRFSGVLERKGEKNRLVLVLKPKAGK